MSTKLAEIYTNQPIVATPLAAQQKPWVWLTEQEVMQTMSGDWTSQFYFARAIEAKIKEKNERKEKNT